MVARGVIITQILGLLSYDCMLRDGRQVKRTMCESDIQQHPGNQSWSKKRSHQRRCTNHYFPLEIPGSTRAAHEEGNLKFHLMKSYQRDQSLEQCGDEGTSG